MHQVIQVVHWAGFPVSDIDTAVNFYTRVLGFVVVSNVEVCGEAYERLYGLFGIRAWIVVLQLGGERLELTEFLTPRGNLIPVTARSQDRSFQHIAIVVSDMDAAYQQLRRQHVHHVSTAPQTLPAWNFAAAGIQAFYFRDPDEHSLELIAFPPGKGEPRWQDKHSLFLGIDHTAIAVENTTCALKLYRDILHMKVVGTSENYGTEQEHLNLVAGAHLRITGLRAPVGIGIELLEYQYPHDGKPMPADSSASDLWAWQTTLVTSRLEAAHAALQLERFSIVSSGIVELPDMRLGFKRGFIVRDADGHLLRIVETTS